MGRRAREERREQREDKVAEQTKVKRKNSLKAAGILALIVVIVGYAGYEFINLDSNAPGAPPGAGKLGDEHEHASLLVRVFGDKFDFTSPAYQIKSSWIHFEDSDGTTIHRHSTGVTLDYLFANLGIGIDSECYKFPDGRQFCSNEDYRLKYYINHQIVKDINDHIIEEGDRILITYGNETPEQIEEQLMELDAQIIKS
uniref:Protein-disulfide isomerase n=1 Tax=uncultured marine thaumarchaeote AD1000_39_D02 TaxID=1455912 RepID=A0A075FVH2_9ARCH|nr:hypothetical protein [uncultured marine thaumarchaeote AD1000_39_D02]